MNFNVKSKFTVKLILCYMNIKYSSFETQIQSTLLELERVHFNHDDKTTQFDNFNPCDIHFNTRATKYPKIKLFCYLTCQ